jgi:hypothetical protein
MARKQNRRLLLTVLVPRPGLRRNPSSWRDYIRGEWWVDASGNAEVADGMTSDYDHAQIAVNSMLNADVILDWFDSRPEEFEGEHAVGRRHAEEWGIASTFWESVPDEVGAEAAGSLERWKLLKKDPRAAYSKYEGAIYVINREFAAWMWTETTMTAVRAFIEGEVAEQGEDYENIDDPRTEATFEQISDGKYASHPLRDFMLMRKPKELWR